MIAGEATGPGTTAGLVAACSLVRVQALGGFEVRIDGRVIAHVDWGRVSAERLFKLLVVTDGHRLTREIAAETLWPGSAPDAGRTNLRKALHFANRALRGSRVLDADAHCVALDEAVLEVDVDRLRSALSILTGEGDRRTTDRRPPRVPRAPTDHPQSRRTSAATAAATAAAAPAAAAAASTEAIDTVLELGGQDLLPDDLYEEWLAGPRERLRAQWQRTALAAAARAREAGKMREAHEIVDRILDRDPTDEAAHRLAIELYACQGRHHAARRQFEQCRVALRASLDVEPSPETVATLADAERAAESRDTPGAATARLVGRGRELERIETVLDRVADGQMACLLIRGPAGIGKTRLLQEVVGYARAAGWPVIGWQSGRSTAALAFAPLRMGLAEVLASTDVATWGEPERSAIAALVPGMTSGAVEFRERSALVAAVAASLLRLCRRGPLVVAIDDLPALDESSLATLATVMASAARDPLLIAATYRDDEPAIPAVLELAGQVRRSGGLDLALGPLGRPDVESLVLHHLGGAAVQADLANRLFARANGNPLFTLEIVRAGVEHGLIRHQDGRWVVEHDATLDELPDSARQIAARRSAALPRPVREALAVAAELGPDFAFATLAACLPERGGRLVGDLDLALASGLIVETRTGYDFAHPLFRLAVLSSSGPARRGTTQLRIARTLAGLPACDLDAQALGRAAERCSDPSLVADHAFSAAGLGVTGARPIAVAFGFAAGRRHRELGDHAAAATTLERALALWRSMPPETAAGFQASAAFTELARIRMNDGDDIRATDAFRSATGAAREPDEVAEVYIGFAELPYRHGDFDGARAIYEEGVARLPESAIVQRARLQADSAWCLTRVHRIAEAVTILEDAVTLLDRHGRSIDVMRPHDELGMTLHYLGRYDEARRHVERSLAVALESRDTTWEMVCDLHLGFLHAREGEPRLARPSFERALELADLVGDRYTAATAAWGMAEAADALGDDRAARDARLREIALLRSFGGNPHNEAMAHAHLAHLARLRGDATGQHREAAEARRLAPLSAEVGYAERIERAISVERWADLET